MPAVVQNILPWMGFQNNNSEPTTTNDGQLEESKRATTSGHSDRMRNKKATKAIDGTNPLYESNRSTSLSGVTDRPNLQPNRKRGKDPSVGVYSARVSLELFT